MVREQRMQSGRRWKLGNHRLKRSNSDGNSEERQSEEKRKRREKAVEA